MTNISVQIPSMKVKILKDTTPYRYLCMGIAAHSPVYKLCLDINQKLDLSLCFSQTPTTETRLENLGQTLFSSEDLQQARSPIVQFQDLVSCPKLEFSLLDLSTQSPKALKKFPFLFMIRSTGNEADLLDWFERLKTEKSLCSSLLDAKKLSQYWT